MEHFGGAGHSKEILKRLDADGLLIGIDRDEEALKAAKENLKEFTNIIYVHENHDNLKKILEEKDLINNQDKEGTIQFIDSSNDEQKKKRFFEIMKE